MIEEKKGSFVDELIKRDAIRSQVPRLKRMLEDYAYLLYKMGDHGRYRGIISALRTDDVFKQAMIYFIRKSLETPQDKKTVRQAL